MSFKCDVYEIVEHSEHLISFSCFKLFVWYCSHGNSTATIDRLENCTKYFDYIDDVQPQTAEGKSCAPPPPAFLLIPWMWTIAHENVVHQCNCVTFGCKLFLVSSKRIFIIWFLLGSQRLSWWILWKVAEKKVSLSTILSPAVLRPRCLSICYQKISYEPLDKF